uniref:Transmembrane protein n=1 Tax=Caulobacter phage BL57 TaxID=3348355 RepID=A0AB74UGW7_9VIRU
MVGRRRDHRPELRSRGGVKTLDEFGIYGWFVFISGLIFGAIWPAGLFAIFWIPVFWFFRKKLNAGFVKVLDAAEGK